MWPAVRTPTNSAGQPCNPPSNPTKQSDQAIHRTCLPEKLLLLPIPPPLLVALWSLVKLSFNNEFASVVVGPWSRGLLAEGPGWWANVCVRMKHKVGRVAVICDVMTICSCCWDVVEEDRGSWRESTRGGAWLVGRCVCKNETKSRKGGSDLWCNDDLLLLLRKLEEAGGSQPEEGPGWRVSVCRNEVMKK